MSKLTKLDECVACGSDDLIISLDLGNQPLANNFLKEVGKNKEYPLAVNRCQSCNHLQLTHVVDPEIIYKNYTYVSGTSQTYIDYMKWFAKWCREYSDFWYGHVLDIGCNDGSQLDAFADIGFVTHGVDPAENLYKTSSKKGHDVVCGFWDKKSIKQLKHDKFDLVVSQNAFAHIPDPVKYLQLLEPLMKDKGLLFIQTSQADMVLNGEFDTIYHEHISFYNIESMNALAKRAGWHLVDAIKTPIHGTSYIFVLSTNRKRPKHIKNLIAMESELQNSLTYDTWATKAVTIKEEFLHTCKEYVINGYKLIGYGAAAKGMTLLNYANVKLDCIIDDNPLKQGTFSPGKDIPIVSSEYLLTISEKDRVLFIPLAWNFFPEIKNKILEKRKNNDDRFLRYFPEVNVEY
ncbi:AdoMet_MTases domain containing protein [uncultured Caudovirales phage]|uniref:AdoMet_MTases domain containing protein n=1 Tax=uncultured Caudovirales phage TaxID=2100421 RepID=A0A6J5LG95_9CAUD|nr:AdoMet_MTases domain containing protein [uncultured Caudovirales phage]